MTEGAAAFDLVATSVQHDADNRVVIYGFGLAFEIPKGYCLLIVPRSSSYKHGALMSNSVGVVDSDYRGEVKAIFKEHIHTYHHPYDDIRCSYQLGERVAQGLIIKLPSVEFEESDELSGSERGSGGFGSTDIV